MSLLCRIGLHAWRPITYVICHRCNRVLGKRMESAVRQMGMTLPEWLRAAADYVERAELWRGINLEAFL